MDLIERIPEGHTPGPWFHEFDDFDTDEPAARRSWSVREASTGGYLYVATPIKGGATQANCALVALAPELAAEVRRQAAEIASLRAVIAEAGEAMRALIDFDQGPWNAKRPDVLDMILRRISAALASIVALDVPAQQEEPKP